MAQASDTLIGQCILRAGRVYVQQQLDAGRDPDKPATRREKMSAMWASTRMGANVASFVVLWAQALLELEVDELGIEEFIEWSDESRSTMQRRLYAFRDLFPGEDTPNRFAAELVAQARKLGSDLRVDLPVPLVVV